MQEFIQQPHVPLSSPGQPAPRRGFFHSFSGLVSTAVLLLVIVYLGILLLSRTAGFAKIVAGQIEKRTGLACQVGHAALTPGLALVMQEVEAGVTKHPLHPGVKAKRVVIRWELTRFLTGGDPLRELLAEDCDLHFALDDAGVWQPAPFGQVSEWLADKLRLDLSRYAPAAAATGVTNAPAPVEQFDLFAEPRVEMRNALVHWQVVADSEIARASGVFLAATRIRLTNREITHFLLSLQKADTAQGFHAENVRMELLEYGPDQLWIEGGPTNTAHTVRPPARKPLSPPSPPPKPAVRVSTNVVPLPAKPPPLPAGSPDPGPEE